MTPGGARDRKDREGDSKLLPGISILTSQATDNVHPTLSACNAPARFLAAEPYRRLRKNAKSKTVAFPTHFSDTFPSPVSIGTEICFGLRFILSCW